MTCTRKVGFSLSMTAVLLSLSVCFSGAALGQIRRLRPLNWKGKDGIEEMARAVREDRADGVVFALRKGVPVNTRIGYSATALIEAAGNGSLAAARALLDRGAAINARDSGGVTALMQAIRWPANRPRNVLPMVKLLLARGADPNVRMKYGYTALYNAIEYNYADVARVLLAAGARE
jgi:ankyrin repeat protein